MAKYSLNIYGKNDEILKTHESNICPWAVYIRAAEMQETMKSMKATEQMDAVGELLMGVLPELTREDLLRADGGDVMNLFAQIVNVGRQIKSNSKN